MKTKTAIMQELTRRSYLAEGVQRVAVNPGTPIEPEDCPAIVLKEGPDKPTRKSKRGGVPVYQRKGVIILEIYIAGSSPQAASDELRAFVGQVKLALFSNGGESLNGNGSLEEDETEDVVAFIGDDNIRGIGILLTVEYVENVADV